MRVKFYCFIYFNNLKEIALQCAFTTYIISLKNLSVNLEIY